MGLVSSAYLKRTFSPRLVKLLCHAWLVMSEDRLVVSGPVPVRIRPSPWLSTGGLRRSCPHAARTRVVFRGHSSASRPPARQVAAASLSPLSSLCGLHLLVRGQHINSNQRRNHMAPQDKKPKPVTTLRCSRIKASI
jgi:hypothetical protein